jgi:hypothetical protein
MISNFKDTGFNVSSPCGLESAAMATAGPTAGPGEATDEGLVMQGVSTAVQECLATLQGLWADVGCPGDERLATCKEIALEVERALQAKISDAREVKAQTALKVRLALRRIKAIYVQLGVETPKTDFACAGDASESSEAACAASSPPEAPQLGLRLQLERLEGMLEAAEAQRAARMAVFTSKTDQLRDLLLEQYGTLDAERIGCLDLSGETDLTEQRERLLMQAIEAGVAAREARRKDIQEAVAAMQKLWEVLGSDEDQEGSDRHRWADLDAEVMAGGSSLAPSTAVLNAAKERLASLQALEEVRHEAVNALLSSLELLWRRVQTPKEEQAAYRKENVGITLNDIQHHESTIGALEQTLAAMLPSLISAGAERLSHLQKALLEEQDPPSAVVGNETPTVAILEQIEASIARATGRLERRQGVLGLIERRDAILKEAAELKNAGQDPSRLLDKSAGSFRVRQQEEKRRNMVSKELPRVTDKLRKAIGDWEEAHAERFVYLGRPYSEIMEEQRLEEEREIEGERQRREEERQRIKAKRSGIAAPPLAASSNSPCVGGHSGSNGHSHAHAGGGVTPKGVAAGALSTPKGVGGKTPLERARCGAAGPVPKSPASGLKAAATPARSLSPSLSLPLPLPLPLALGHQGCCDAC